AELQRNVVDAPGAKFRGRQGTGDGEVLTPQLDPNLDLRGGAAEAHRDRKLRATGREHDDRIEQHLPGTGDLDPGSVRIARTEVRARRRVEIEGDHCRL